MFNKIELIPSSASQNFSFGLIDLPLLETVDSLEPISMLRVSLEKML